MQGKGVLVLSSSGRGGGRVPSTGQSLPGPPGHKHVLNSCGLSAAPLGSTGQGDSLAACRPQTFHPRTQG